MRLPFRVLLALACGLVLLFAPSLDSLEDRTWLARLRVREWLLGDDSPLGAWANAGRVPPLAVELRTSPPIVDDEARRRAAEAFPAIVAEWAAKNSSPEAPLRVDPQAAPLPLQVVVGSDGFQALLPQPRDGTVRLLLPYASRWSLLPAVAAIALAVLTQRVLLALLAACVLGAIVYVGGLLPGQASTSLAQLGYTAPLGVVDTLVAGPWHFVADALWRRSLCSDFYVRITLFVVFLFMTVGLITGNGGVQGLVDVLQRRVRGPLSAQLCTFFAGVAVFFDDYTNCLLVGSSMRPLTDASRVSREKLAYLVDSTAAPIAGLSVFSTWVTYEMSQYRAPLALVTKPDGTPYVPDDAFAVFVQTLPFRCYCWFALALVVLVIVMRRDFGPMLSAEQRARRGHRAPADASATDTGLHAALPAGDGKPTPRARNAVLPLATLVLGTIGGMLWFGLTATASEPAANWAERVQAVLANARSDVALFQASVAAWLLAVVLTLGQRLLPVGEVVRTSLRATRSLALAFGILFLAWSLGHLCSDLGTSFYLSTAARGAMTATLLPILLFVTAGAIAFATGTSFGTMAILLPNVVVLAHHVGTDSAFTGSAAAGGPALMLLCIGAVLEGAIFGDHCSPISDTTVLSSLGSGCPLLAHVQTQLPYALLAFAASALCGYLPLTLIGPHVWPLCLLTGVAAMALVLRLVGRDAAAPAA